MVSVYRIVHFANRGSSPPTIYKDNILVRYVVLPALRHPNIFQLGWKAAQQIKYNFISMICHFASTWYIALPLPLCATSPGRGTLPRRCPSPRRDASPRRATSPLRGTSLDIALRLAVVLRLAVMLFPTMILRLAVVLRLATACRLAVLFAI